MGSFNARCYSLEVGVLLSPPASRAARASLPSEGAAHYYRAVWFRLVVGSDAGGGGGVGRRREGGGRVSDVVAVWLMNGPAPGLSDCIGVLGVTGGLSGQRVGPRPPTIGLIARAPRALPCHFQGSTFGYSCIATAHTPTPDCPTHSSNQASGVLFSSLRPAANRWPGEVGGGRAENPPGLVRSCPSSGVTASHSFSTTPDTSKRATVTGAATELGSPNPMSKVQLTRCSHPFNLESALNTPPL